MNTGGTLNVLEACRRNHVKSALTSPATVYGASKLVGEHYALACFRCYWPTTTVFRSFNNYGPRAH